MALYELWLADAFGNRLELLDSVRELDIVLVVGDVGWLSVVAATSATTHLSTPARDRQLQVYRDRELLGVALLRSWTRTQLRGGGGYLVTVGGSDPNELAARRIVRYAAGSAEADKSAAADNLMKEVMRENLGSDAIAARDWSAQGFSVEANRSDGPTVAKAFAYQNVLTVLQSVQASSVGAGSPIYWAIRTEAPGVYVFETYPTRFGRDRTAGHRAIFAGPDYGNLPGGALTHDYTTEVTLAVAGGQNEGDARNIQTAEDDDRTDASPLGLREGFISATQLTTDAALVDAAEEYLTERRPVVRIDGDLLATSDFPYGGAYGWRLGDRINVQLDGYTLRATVRSVRFSLLPNGLERITGKLEQDEL